MYGVAVSVIQRDRAFDEDIHFLANYSNNFTSI